MIMHETEADRRAEWEIVNELLARWGARAKKLHLKYKLDFMVYKSNKAIAWVEAKDRPTWEGYETYLLGFHKWCGAHQYLSFSRLPTVIAVRLKGQLMTYNVAPYDLGEFDIREGGRMDRDETADIEPVIHIPIEKFSLFDEHNELWESPVLPLTIDRQNNLPLTSDRQNLGELDES